MTDSPISQTTGPDIVWCLRANADDCDQNDDAFSGAACQAKLDREAVDEIERLRNAVQILKGERTRLLGSIRDLKADAIARCDGALLS